MTKFGNLYVAYSLLKKCLFPGQGIWSLVLWRIMKIPPSSRSYISHEMCAQSPMLLGWVQINENDLVSKIDYRGLYVISFKVNWFGIISERFGEILEVFISSRGYLTIRLHQACFVVLSMLLCISNLACPSLNLYLFLGRTVKYRTSSGGYGECWF